MGTIESQQPEGRIGLGRTLTYYIKSGSRRGFMAFCPELDIAYGGETQEEAMEKLFRLARAEVQGILSGKGDLPGRPDERRLLAEFLKGVDDFSSVFERVLEPPQGWQGAWPGDLTQRSAAPEEIQQLRQSIAQSDNRLLDDKKKLKDLYPEATDEDLNRLESDI